jgi:hypothetical protein
MIFFFIEFDNIEENNEWISLDRIIKFSDWNNIILCY